MSTPILYGWQIDKRVPHHEKPGTHIRQTETIAAETFEQVLEWLARDRMDQAVEIEAVVRFGPILTVIREPKGEGK